MIPISSSTVYYALNSPTTTIFMSDLFYTSTYGCIPRNCFDEISLTTGCTSTINLMYWGNGRFTTSNVDGVPDGSVVC